MRRKFTALQLIALCAVLAGCSANGPASDQAAVDPSATAAPTLDAATRSSPVVVGRPARVFVFAGVGKNCEPVAAPQVAVTAQPAKGDVTFKPGQETAIAASAQGTCVGQKSTGTGVYYTARAGSNGTDRFSVQAKLASGEVSTRTFEVKIEE
jgi:predicted small lipoprotein YifL